MEIIRLETKEDYRQVEEITRKAFWNLYGPGCNEHYMVHVMRNHPDFIPELAFVTELDGKVIANVMYTKAKLTDDFGNQKEILSFGPISVDPEYQRLSYGKRMLEKSFVAAKALGYDVIAIFGNPPNYMSRGFKNCKKYNVSFPQKGMFPTALLVLELVPNTLNGQSYIFSESSVCQIDEEAASEFDKSFPHLEKIEGTASQEEFYIYSHSSIVR